MKVIKKPITYRWRVMAPALGPSGGVVRNDELQKNTSLIADELASRMESMMTFISL